MTAGMLMRTQVAVLLALVALTGAGCATLDSQGCHGSPPVGSPRILTVVWHPQIYPNPDAAPGHNGQLVPMLAGTLYMMGDNDCFITSPGNVVVDLYDVSNGQEPHQLERWIFDPESLKKLVKCDGIGWGYKLILPWGTYRPDVTKVELRTQLDRENMAPLYSGSSTVTLVQPDHPLTLPGSEPQKPPQLLLGPPQQPGSATGIQQTSHMTMGPAATASGSGVQPAFQASVPGPTGPQGPQMSVEQMQQIVQQYQAQIRQMQQQQER